MPHRIPHLLRSAAGLLLVAGLAAVPPAGAQTSRAAELRAKRAEKAKALEPYKPGLIEKMTAFAGERESAGRPLGFYPYFGSIFTGGAVAVGLGYRHPFLDTGELQVDAAVSPKLYSKFETHLHFPTFARDRVRVTARLLWLNATKVNFYGIGNDTRARNRSTFRHNPTTIGGLLELKPARWLTLGGSLDFLDSQTGKGRRAPSIDEVFRPDEVPGFGLDTSYLTTSAFVDVDTRPTPSRATRGGHYRVDLRDFRERGDGRYSFRLVEAEASQFIPLLRENWVIALRARAEMASAGNGRDVPYSWMPTLGSSRDLRGFSNFRFRDRHTLVLTAEYRWTPSRLVDMVVFYDAGKVAAKVSQLGLQNLHSNWGVGARFHTGTATIVRLEVARSGERTRFVFGVGPNF